MPYIDSEDRKAMDIEELATYFAEMDLPKFAGHLNYLNFKIVKTYIKKNGQKYFTFAVVVGTLVCCILEIYRRLAAPYEDIKIKGNGDVE